MSELRDIKLASAPNETLGGGGRNTIAVIGIDRYHHWQPLTNAVRDATGAAALFQQLGFEQAAAPLLDDRATGKAIQSLVTDDLRKLGPEDSLVLFYAGHGSTQKYPLGNQVIKTGYLIPVDAQDKVATWIDLEGWLRAVSLLPARHILVVLDSCHNGIALDPVVKWRNVGSRQDAPLSTLSTRRSRRVITSALDDQVALDSGPIYGHSLFTGCLIEALTHGVHPGNRVTTGSELGLYVQRRVETYPSSRQTPDFGAFAFDDRGEMVIPLMTAPAPPDDDRDPDSADLVSRPTPVHLEATKPAPVPPLPPVSVASIATTPDPTAEIVSHPRDRRWSHPRRVRLITMGNAAVVAAVSVLVGYRILGDRSPPGAPPVPAAAAADHRSVARVVAEGTQPARRLREHCPDGMVAVPAGTFQMGSPAGVGEDDEYRHEVTLSSYCIDKTEVTVKAYAACVEAKGCSPALLTVKGNRLSADRVSLYNRFCNGADRPDHPINCIDWDQAMAYCTWAGKRLPTEAEWEYAARGQDGRVYPWGNEAPSAKRLNACGSECVAMAKRDLHEDWEALYVASDGWETTAPVGSFPDGASPFGALDMAGNVFEWTADWYGPYEPAAAVNPRGSPTGSSRVDRGGGWNLHDASYLRSAFRPWVTPSDRVIDVGFRCAREN